MPIIESSLDKQLSWLIYITYTIYYNQISVHQNQLRKMDAHQQQDALVHLFRNDGVMNHLINEASFVNF